MVRGRSVDQIDFIKDAAPLNCHGMYSHLSSETLQLGRENSQHKNFTSFAEKKLEHCGSLGMLRSFKTKVDITEIYIGSEMWQIWTLNSAVCSGAIFHRAQTWHLKCRSSTIVEIVEIWSSARNLVETSRVLGARTT